MKIKYLKFRHWLLLALLGAMGVASCSKDMYGTPEEDYDGPRLMYGVTETKYNENL